MFLFMLLFSFKSSQALDLHSNHPFLINSFTLAFSFGRLVVVVVSSSFVYYFVMFLIFIVEFINLIVVCCNVRGNRDDGAKCSIIHDSLIKFS